MKIVETPPGPPVIASVVAEVYGQPDDSYEKLLSAADTVKARFAVEPGVSDIDTIREFPREKLIFIPDNEKELKRSVESNVFSPLMVLEATYRLRSHGALKSLRKILTFGSAAEYGSSDTKRWTETSKDTRPNSFYGLVKHWLFDTARFYQQFGLPCVHLRHFNAVGTGQDSRFVLSAFCKQVSMLERGKKPRILMVGDITQKRDFIDIRDAVEAYDLVLKYAKPGQTANICSGKVYSVKKIIDVLRKHSVVPFKTKIDPRLIAHKRTRNKTLAGTPRWLLRHGWKPVHSLEDSVMWVLEYWRKKLSK